MTENPPENPDFEKLNRNILASNPRVTKFKIQWEDPNAFKSPLLDENCPPIPNTLPPRMNEDSNDSPLKRPLVGELNPVSKNSDDMEIGL